MGNRVICGETADSNDQTFPSSNESNDEFIPVRSATGVGDTRYNPILSHPPPLFTRNGPHRRMNSIGPSFRRHFHLQPDGRVSVAACSFRHRAGREKSSDRLESLSHILFLTACQARSPAPDRYRISRSSGVSTSWRAPGSAVSTSTTRSGCDSGNIRKPPAKPLSSARMENGNTIG